MAADINRREALLGLASASLLVASGRAFAQPVVREGVEIKVLKTASTMIPGYAKVQLREITYQPGGKISAPMGNDMICECTQGALEVSLHDQPPVTMNKGDIWTCFKGMMEVTTNKGTAPAVMRLFDLLPA